MRFLSCLLITMMIFLCVSCQNENKNSSSNSDSSQYDSSSVNSVDPSGSGEQNTSSESSGPEISGDISVISSNSANVSNSISSSVFSSGSQMSSSSFSSNISTSSNSSSSSISQYEAIVFKAFNKDYYVSAATGNDDNDGLSPAKAFKTLSKISDMTFVAGDVIHLKCGETWNERLTLNGNGSKEHPIVLTSYGSGKRPVISFGSGNVVSLINASGWRISGICAVSTNTVGLKSGAPNNAIYVLYNSEKVSSNLEIDNNLIYGAGYTYNASGIYITGLYPTGHGLAMSNISIHNNTVHDVGWVGIRVCGWDTSINNNLGSKKIFSNVSIFSNVVYNTGVLNCYLMCTTKGVVERNLFYNGGLYDVPGGSGWGPVGFMTIVCSDVDVRFNEVYGMKDSNTGWDGSGIDIDWTCDNIRITNNYIHDNTGSGIVTMSCQDSVISGNRVENNTGRNYLGAQMNISDLSVDQTPNAPTGVINLDVNNNLLISNKPSNHGLSCIHYSSGTWSGFSFTNNSIVLKNSTGSAFYKLRPGTSLNSSNYNKLYSVSGTHFLAVMENLQKTFNSFSEWKSAGYDNNSTLNTIDTTTPSKVTNIKASVIGGKISVSWKASTDSSGNMWHYKIFASKTPEAGVKYINMVGQTTSLSGEYLPPYGAGSYYIRIQAEDYCGNLSPVSDEIKITVN